MKSEGRQDTFLTREEAAAVLGVTAETLRDWSSIYGCPQTHRGRGDRDEYSLREVELLSGALATTVSLPAAILHVRSEFGQAAGTRRAANGAPGESAFRATGRSPLERRACRALKPRRPACALC